MEHNALVAEVKQAALTLTGKNRQSLHGFVTGRILKKYPAVNAVRRETGNNIRKRIHQKTITSSPKKADCFIGTLKLRKESSNF